jgi:hypothetical protein
VPVEEIRSGDVVWIPPGEKHWHGASPTVAMMHIAIQEALDGKVADWLEKVSDEQHVLEIAYSRAKAERRDSGPRPLAITMTCFPEAVR